MDQKKTVRPFSMKDKIGYTLGDLGCCFTEQYRAMYLSIFYTLILQVNPFHVGILLLVTKIWDAVNDPIIGAIVDSRKATKGGKFIPWIRAFSFPMAVLCILGFVNVGNINYGLRLAYMFVTYVLYEALYTCVNVPFGTLSSVMTDDVSQRTALSRYRSLGGTIFMTVMVMIGPLFLYVDNKPVAGRFLMLACICAIRGHRLLHLLLLPQACKRHFRQPVQLCAGCHRLQRDRRRCADRRRCERHLEELHRRLLPGLRHCSCHPVLRLPPDQAEDC